MPTARIIEETRSPTQSGRRRVGAWSLEFDVQEGQRHDPLTGWLGSGDTRKQVKLSFPSREAAIGYCEAQGLVYEIVAKPPERLKLQAYADNFR